MRASAEDVEGDEHWDRQNASQLDGPAYIRGLQQEGSAPKPDEEPAQDGDDEEYEQRMIEQVQRDRQAEADWSESDSAVASKKQSSEVMQQAVRSSRAKAIVPAIEPQESFRMTGTLSVAVYQGCVFFNQYLVVRFLGKGACGKVYLVMDTLDNKLYALKITHKSDISKDAAKAGRDGKPAKAPKDPMEDLRAEVAIMGRVAHPNMVVLKEVVDDPQRNKVLIVMNYAEGGPILPRKAISQGIWLPENICRQYFRDMVRSLEYLHSQKVIHGDLKPENILLTSSGVVKLSDFGCSRVFVTGNEYFDRFRGTPAFLAPEMMKPQTHYRGRPVDVYAMGVCLYALAFGTIPFSASNLFKLFQRVQEEPVRFPSHPPVSESLISLLERLLDKDPKRRITIAELLSDPWVTLNGTYPMRPFKQLFRNGVLQYDPDPPQTNYLKDMLQLQHRYVTFAPGTVVIQQGEVGYYLALITEGEVEVCVKPRPGGDSNGKAEDAQALAHDSKLLAQLLRRSANARKAIKAKKRQDGLYCIAERSTGDVLGEMALIRESHSRKATVIARTPLKVALYTYAEIEAYGTSQPGAIHQLKQLCWQRDAELMYFAAMYRLAEAHEYFVSCLQGQGYTREQLAQMGTGR